MRIGWYWAKHKSPEWCPLLMFLRWDGFCWSGCEDEIPFLADEIEPVAFVTEAQAVVF